MKTRPSGLGSVFAILDTGLKIRLEECTECDRLILTQNWLEFPPGIRQSSLEEMEKARVDTGFSYWSNANGLVCHYCVDRENDLREFLSRFNCPFELYVATKCD